MRTISQSATTILSVIIVLSLLFVLDYSSAQWSPAPASPPNNNASAPINTGTSPQIKMGPIAITGLMVGGNQLLTGDLEISNSGPVISFDDSDDNGWFANVDNNRFILMFDGNDNGSIDGDSPAPGGDGTWPLELSGSSPNYAAFSNQVRANEYCDRDGNNCIDPATGGGSGQSLMVNVWGTSVPSGISTWPDWIRCNDKLFTVTGDSLYKDQQNSDPRAIRFNSSGQNDNAYDANVRHPDCSSIQQPCDDGRCGFYGGGGPPTVTSVPSPLPYTAPPPPPPSTGGGS